MMTALATYLLTGHTEYPNDTRQLREGLVAEVRRRSAGTRSRDFPAVDLAKLTRRKVEPMVRGLFPKTEQSVVLQALENSTVMICTETIEELILEETWSHTAWALANIYLNSLGLDLLNPNEDKAVGMNQHLTSYITPSYFDEEDPLADFIVHEAAHVFHNCKRRTLNFKATRNREWLLPIAFAHREKFALACEAYSKILELAGSPAARRQLVEEIGEESVFRVVTNILAAAVLKRNGWKEILRLCS